MQDAITSFYSTHILSAKTAVPRYASVSPPFLRYSLLTFAQRAFSPYLAEFISYSTLSDKLIPTAERMLLRSPETALDRMSIVSFGAL